MIQQEADWLEDGPSDAPVRHVAVANFLPRLEGRRVVTAYVRGFIWFDDNTREPFKGVLKRTVCGWSLRCKDFLEPAIHARVKQAAVYQAGKGGGA